jgi:GSH-dependent disulfide-bond oxidoreductase
MYPLMTGPRRRGKSGRGKLDTATSLASPIAGRSCASATSEACRMIRFYYHPSPNPAKVAHFLEEAELPYELVPVDTRKGEQHQPAFLAINPNGKTPAIVDGEAVVFDSNAILLYLAEKTGRFLPEGTPALRGQLLSWLMFVATGIGPYSGQAVHFTHFAPEPKAYALNRYRHEALRHWGILDAHLAGRRYMVGESYTIVDMAIGAGRRASRSSWARKPGPDCPPSSAWSTRSAPGRRRNGPPR